MLGAFAEFEREKIIKHTTRGWRHRIRSGGIVSQGNRTFGYGYMAKTTTDLGRASRPLLFQGDSDCRDCRQPHLLPLDIRDQSQIDKMVMAFVPSFAAVGLDKLDPAVFNAVDSSDMNPVRSDHFHMLLYLTDTHFISPRSSVATLFEIAHRAV
jgi:hypothetical protein